MPESASTPPLHTLQVLPTIPPFLTVGVVNKVGRDFIGLLVAGIVNASIGADAIRADLASRPAQSAWVSLCNSRHVISIGTTVVFDVLR